MGYISPGYSVIIPVYFAADTLSDLIGQLVPALTALERPYEIILVNDGSRDRSWEIIETLAAINPNIIGINLMRNYGQHNALLCGIRQAGTTSPSPWMTICSTAPNPSRSSWPKWMRAMTWYMARLKRNSTVYSAMRLP